MGASERMHIEIANNMFPPLNANALSPENAAMLISG